MSVIGKRSALPFQLEEAISVIDQQNFSVWASRLAQELPPLYVPGRNGNVPRWLKLISELPRCDAAAWDFTVDAIKIGHGDELSDAARTELECLLMQFAPWRKGPFNVFGIHVNAEWQSNLKWRRLEKSLAPLVGKRVLDVGCGNGYYALRMCGLGAKWVLGVDPSALALSQFTAIRHFIQDDFPVTLLPLGMESVPRQLRVFDTVFSMGVLYHRRSPFDHLEHLRESLCDGGQLILETLVIDAPKGKVLVPGERYAQMRNVWFIPSVLELLHWMKRAGFKQVECVDCTATTVEEQRTTPWMPFHSFRDFVDPVDITKTVEGYPAPLRAIISATV